MAKIKKTTTVVTEEIVEDGIGLVKPLDVYVLLDGSGSMDWIRDKTITSFNEYLNTLKGAKGRVTLVSFDSGQQGELRYRVMREKMPIASVKPLSRADYAPAGGTPLNDAAGRMIKEIDRGFSADHNVVMVVLTDGQENSSREFKSEQIKTMLEDRKTRNGWLVLYLGANQDAAFEGSSRGFSLNNSASYNTLNMGQTMRAAASATMRYHGAGGGALGLQQSSFTDEERESMSGDEIGKPGGGAKGPGSASGKTTDRTA